MCNAKTHLVATSHNMEVVKEKMLNHRDLVDAI